MFRNHIKDLLSSIGAAMKPFSSRIGDMNKVAKAKEQVATRNAKRTTDITAAGKPLANPTSRGRDISRDGITGRGGRTDRDGTTDRGGLHSRNIETIGEPSSTKQLSKNDAGQQVVTNVGSYLPTLTVGAKSPSFLNANFGSEVIKRVNALWNMRGEQGIKITKADAGFVFSADIPKDKDNKPDSPSTGNNGSGSVYTTNYSCMCRYV